VTPESARRLLVQYERLRERRGGRRGTHVSLALGQRRQVGQVLQTRFGPGQILAIHPDSRLTVLVSLDRAIEVLRAELGASRGQAQVEDAA
jgi:hypothetical protein